MLPIEGIAAEILAGLCPHCRDGAVPRYRPDTDEMVHDLGKGNLFIHTLCFGTTYMREQRKKEA